MPSGARERYSNRFAAHILRQHQFNALCAARGWKNKLRLMVDDEYPPATRELPHWGLRAEFWIEGIGDDYGQDTNEVGTYLRLATDQVRFYRTGAAQNSAHAGRWRLPSATRSDRHRRGQRAAAHAIRFRRWSSRRSCVTSTCSSAWRASATIRPGRTAAARPAIATIGGSTRSASYPRLPHDARRLERLIPRLKIANRCCR